MSEKVALAERAYAALGRDDWDALAEILAPEFELQRGGGMGTIGGIDAAREFRAPEAFEWQHEEPDGEFIEHGNRLFVGIRSSARGSGSSIEVEQRVFHVATFRGGMIARLEIHFDRAQALEALERPGL